MAYNDVYGLSLIVALLALVYWIYLFAVAPFRVLARYGIRGPLPLPFYGNWKAMTRVGQLKFIDETVKRYGPVYGVYLGQRPVVLISDLDLLNEVTVKCFDHFHDRPPVPDLFFKERGTPPGLIHACGDFWRKIRVTISPAFSSAKIKMMAPLIDDHCKTLVEKLGEYVDTNISVDVFDLFGKLALETIIATAFGRIIDIQRGESDQLVDAVKIFLSGVTEEKNLSVDKLLIILTNFPCAEPLIRYFVQKSKVTAAFTTMCEVGENLVKARRLSPNQHNYTDILQLLINATAEDKCEHRRLTSLEIVSQCVTFIGAAYDTSASALSYTANLLALNPDIQKKLIDQIKIYISDHPDLSLYDMAQKLTYVDMVVKESLRLYSPAPLVARYCSKTCKVGSIVIPKGALVHIPIGHIHRDPQHWKYPEKFDPERFNPEVKSKRHSLAYIPFGWGPRSCIGMRFALLEIKLALITVLKRYKFVRAPETEDPVQVTLGFAMSPKNGVFLRIASHGP